MDDSIKIITLSPGRYRVYKGAEQFDCAHIDDVITCVYQCLTEQKVTSAVPVKGETIDFDRFTEFFNSSVCGTVIPQVRKLTDKRKKTIKARLAEKEVTKATLMEVVTRAAASDFLSGRNGQWRRIARSTGYSTPTTFRKYLKGIMTTDITKSDRKVCLPAEVNAEIRQLTTSPATYLENLPAESPSDRRPEGR